MGDFDEYESLPDSTPLTVTMMAGAAAGVSEHCAMFPIDSVKTRMQSVDCDRGSHRGIASTLRVMINEEGLVRPMRGFSAMALGSGPAHALYFSTYERLKDSLNSISSMPAFWSQGFAGIGATVCHDSLMTPAEVVKQRMQMCCSPFKSIFKAVSTIYRTEGVNAFYRSFFTSLSMNVPYQVSHFWTYELMMNMMNPEGHYNPMVHFASGAMAGAVASSVTMPLDTCKTLLNTQEPAVLKRINSSRIVGMRNAAFIIYSFKGIKGFFQGLQARVVYQMPATAISWSVYEFFKQYLKSRDVEASQKDKYETISEFSVRPSANEIFVSKFQSKADKEWGAFVPGLVTSTDLVLMDKIKSE